MPAPLVFVGFPALLALVINILANRFVRRGEEERSQMWLAIVAALGSAILALLAIGLPLDERVLWGRLMISSSFAVLGRTLLKTRPMTLTRR